MGKRGDVNGFARGTLSALLLVVALARPAAASAPSLLRSGSAHVPVAIPPETVFHTLASDFFVQRDGTLYVQTGDIPAMWLRDAAAQTLPYVRLASARPALRTWIRGVIWREARNIDVDPYANAFKVDYKVWERKWEVDSLAYPVLLAWAYEQQVPDRRLFTKAVHRALGRIVATYDCERRHARCSRYAADRGPARTTGMIWSAFRPSDDPTRFGYSVPEQMIAVTALRDLADLARNGYRDGALAKRALAMATGIERAIARYGEVYDFRCGGQVYAYEVDGLGHWLIADDANVPSLLGAPLVGYLSIDDPVYHRTRECMLSGRNRYYYSGRFARGEGSPHTPRGFVWPLALETRALTSSNRREIVEQLQELAASAGSDGHIHESFDPNRPARFTRAEFGWANATYAALLFRTAAGYGPIAVGPAPEGPFRRFVAESLTVVDPMTAANNRAALLDAFERVIPMRVVGRESGS